MKIPDGNGNLIINLNKEKTALFPVELQVFKGKGQGYGNENERRWK